MARTELAKRAVRDLERMDGITSALIMGWIRRHLLTLDDPKSIGASLGGSKRWQYRIGDYRLLADVSTGLGEAMTGLDISALSPAERMQERGL